AVSGANGLHLWSIDHGVQSELISSIPITYLDAAAFNPTGDLLALAGHDGHAQIWNIADPRKPSRVADMDTLGLVNQVQFSPDGQTLLTAGQGGADLWVGGGASLGSYLAALSD